MTATKQTRELAVNLIRSMIAEGIDPQSTFDSLADCGVFTEPLSVVCEIMAGYHCNSDEGKTVLGLIDWGNAWPVVDGDGILQADCYDSDQDSRSHTVTMVSWDRDREQLVDMEGIGSDFATFDTVEPIDEAETAE